MDPVKIDRKRFFGIIVLNIAVDDIIVYKVTQILIIYVDWSYR